MKKVKTKVKQYVDKNPIEQLLSIGGGVVSQVADTGKNVINLDNWGEYLGLEDNKEKQKKHHGELAEGQELNLKDLQKNSPADEQEAAHREPGIDYVSKLVHSGEKAQQTYSHETMNKIQQIMFELKKLIDSTKELQTQFKEVAVEQVVVKPGKYHESFFEWLLSVIKIARQKVEDSGAWLSAMQSKKKQRQYGAMAKKHGTTFTLNNERTVATQTG